MGPALTSGGLFADCRTIATLDPSRENEALGSQVSLLSPISSSPVHSVCTGPPFRLTEAMLEFPSESCAKTIRSAAAQASADGELLIPGVKLRARPPAKGTV